MCIRDRNNREQSARNFVCYIYGYARICCISFEMGTCSVKLLFENWRKYLSEGLAQEEVQSIVDRIFDQIVNDRGPARQGKPKVELHADIYARHSGIAGMKGEVSKEAKAEFVDEENAIYVYYPNMTNEEDIIRSILHEYEHARQDPKKYEKYREEGFDGLDNPYEKAARRAEETWEKYSIDWAGEPPE